MIRSKQLGGRIDYDLIQFREAETDENNGKVIYIRDGKLAFENGDKLFNLTPLNPTGE